MLAYTVYNQSGGQAKTTLARDLASAHAEVGDDVLIIDLDPQNGSLSNYFGVDEDKQNKDVDNIVNHIIKNPDGDFHDLIRNAEHGIDVIPSHKKLSNLEYTLNDAERFYERQDTDFDPHTQLRRVLEENNVVKDYDTLIVDPNAKADMGFYNALHATRNIIIPAVPTRSGYESIDGVTASAKGFAKNYDIDLGRLAVVPTIVDMRKSEHKTWAKKIKEDYNSPVYFKSLGAFETAENSYTTTFNLLNNERDRVRNSEQNILPKYRTLLATIRAEAGKPVPRSEWSSDEIFTGDDFWGEVDVPLADEKTTPAEVN